jgi:hypothetical protein
MDAMNLGNITSRFWSIHACSALKGSGIEEGLEWLVEVISKKNK